MGTATMDAPPVADYGDAPTIVLTSIGEPQRLPGDLLEFPCYRLTKDGDGNLCRRLVGYVIWPISSVADGLLIAAAALAKAGVPVVADAGTISPLH